MEKGFVENGFIIDLSDAKNTTQLVFELSSIMEHPDVKRKNVCLKLGSLDLKQSQLLYQSFDRINGCKYCFY